MDSVADSAEIAPETPAASTKRSRGVPAWAQHPWVGPTIAAILVFIAYAQIALRNWAALATNGFDTGIMAQIVQAYARFQIPHSAIKGFPNIFADHFSPIMATLAPLWWVWPDPRVVLLAQAALLGLGAAGIYVVGRRHLGVAIAIAAVALFATWPGTQDGGSMDMHEVAFYVPLTVWAIERGLAGKWRTAWILAACLLLVREDGGLMLASFAVWAFIRGRRKDAVVAFIAGIAATVLVSALLKHLDNSIGFTGYFPLQNLGPTPTAAFLHIITHPLQTLHSLVSPSIKWHTIIGTFSPFTFFPLLSSMIVMVLPQLLLRLLGGREVLWTISFHYSLPIAGILALAYIDGIMRVKGWLTKKTDAAQAVRRTQLLQFVVVVLAAVSVVLSLNGGSLIEGNHSFVLDAYAPSCRAALGKIPKGAMVAASNSTAAYLVAQHDVRLWRGGARPGEYILIGPPGDDSHLGRLRLAAIARLRQVATPIQRGSGCQLFHYTLTRPLPELITINQIQPDPTGKTRG